MISICPTITSSNPDDYRNQMERVASFAHRVHIDLGDGLFTPNKLTPPDQVWWPGGMRADLHMMYQKPFEQLDALIALGPQLIIVHAEADGDFARFATTVHRHGIEAGVALLATTQVETIKPALGLIDHVLVFSGNLGYQGGSRADLNLLAKVEAIKEIRPNIEIGWDGGVSDKNIKQLVEGGVEVVNVGGFIQKTSDPERAYLDLATLI